MPNNQKSFVNKKKRPTRVAAGALFGCREQLNVIISRSDFWNVTLIGIGVDPSSDNSQWHVCSRQPRKTLYDFIMRVANHPRLNNNNEIRVACFGLVNRLNKCRKFLLIRYILDIRIPFSSPSNSKWFFFHKSKRVIKQPNRYSAAKTASNTGRPRSGFGCVCWNRSQGRSRRRGARRVSCF